MGNMADDGTQATVMNSPQSWHYQIQSTSIIAPAAAVLVLMLVFVPLRLWSVKAGGSSIDASCVSILLAFISAVSAISLDLSFLIMNANENHAIEKEPSMTVDTSHDSFRTLFVAIVLSYISIATAKFALVFLYRPALPTRIVRASTAFLGCIILAWVIAIVFATIFACNPIEAFWRLSPDWVSSGNDLRCFDRTALFAYGTLPDIVANVILFILPLRELWDLPMTKSTRIEINAMLIFGGVVSVIAIIRFVITLVSGTYLIGIPWLIAEVGLSVVCVCMPGIGPAVHRKQYPSIDISSTTRRYTGSQRPYRFRGSQKLPETCEIRGGGNVKPNIMHRAVEKLKDALGWQPLPVVDSSKMHIRNPSLYTERGANSTRFPEYTSYKDGGFVPASKTRDPADMEVYRREYEYSGSNPFSQELYSHMTDTELWGGIKVEQTVDLRVETMEQVERIEEPLKVYDGSKSEYSGCTSRSGEGV